MKIKCFFKSRRTQIALVVREERGRGGLRCITQFLVTTYLHVFWVLKHNFHKHCLQNIYCFVVKIKVSSARVIKRRQVNIEIIMIAFDYSKKMYVYCLTWEFNSKLLVKGNLRGIRYFTCWSEHMKHKDNLWIWENSSCPREIEPHPQRWPSVILTTAPVLPRLQVCCNLCWTNDTVWRLLQKCMELSKVASLSINNAYVYSLGSIGCECICNIHNIVVLLLQTTSSCLFLIRVFFYHILMGIKELL